jgi:putative tryptophan/tyrosine transport system substrate-binding protein
MRRREIIAALGVAAWPLATRAQQPTMPVIGFLHSASPAGYAEFATAFQQGLAEVGFVEGRNVATEYRWADGAYDRLPALAAELAQLQPTVIFANNPGALHVKAATTTIPIVFTAGFDPIELGLVTNLKQPGGNITGVSILNVELGPKRLEFPQELVIGAVMALLVNPANPNVPSQTREVQAAAQRLGLQLHVLRASTDGQLTDIFAKLRELRSSALLIGTDPFFNTRGRQLAALALRHAMPAIYQYRDFVAAGGLMSYGANLANAYRLAGSYVGRILKGDKPADLPVQQSTKIELIFKLKTAKALGINVPESLLARADEVIE